MSSQFCICGPFAAGWSFIRQSVYDLFAWCSISCLVYLSAAHFFRSINDAVHIRTGTTCITQGQVCADFAWKCYRVFKQPHRPHPNIATQTRGPMLCTLCVYFFQSCAGKKKPLWWQWGTRAQYSMYRELFFEEPA